MSIAAVLRGEKVHQLKVHVISKVTDTRFIIHDSKSTATLECQNTDQANLVKIEKGLILIKLTKRNSEGKFYLEY